MNAKEKVIYYFGCNDRPGHYMHKPGMSTGVELEERRAIGAFTRTNPWGYGIDGTLCPKGINEKEGLADIHVKDGWTAIAFWDRSVDRRGGCNSVFIAKGLFDFAEMLAMAKESFPQVFARFKFEVRALNSTTPTENES